MKLQFLRFLKKSGVCLACLFRAAIFALIFSPSVQAATIGTASWYSSEACQFNPDPKCPMANGRSLYDAEQTETDFAAMWGVPFGTRVKVTNLANGKSVVVTVTDRGPAKRLNRVIDLSKRSFEKIAPLSSGIISVRAEVL